ncbi:MAG: hypothetical protein K2X47_20625, partial [Bdellovibrionales bacterium]|nr:hypothetical protein [Bdellovibrionales bacterium]
VGTGKVDFSYEKGGDPLIAFHMDSAQKSLGAWKRNPPKNQVLDIFVFNLEIRRLAKVTHNLLDNSWYPNFTSDRHLVFSHHRTGQKFSSFRKASIKDLEWVDFEAVKSDPRRDRWVALGRLFYRACSDIDQVQSQFAELTARSLSRFQCEALLRTEWPRHQAKVGEDFRRDEKTMGTFFTTPADISEICAQAQEPKVQAPVRVIRGSGFQASQLAATSNPGADVLLAKCMNCHDAGRPQALQLQSAKSQPLLLRKISCRLSLPSSDPRHMPVGSSLSESEKKWLSVFFGTQFSAETCAP